MSGVGLKASPAQRSVFQPHLHSPPIPLHSPALSPPSPLLSAESAIKGGPAGLQKLLKDTSGQLQRLAGSDYTGATLLQLKKQVGGEKRAVREMQSDLKPSALTCLPSFPPPSCSGSDP